MKVTDMITGRKFEQASKAIMHLPFIRGAHYSNICRRTHYPEAFPHDFQANAGILGLP